MRAGKWGLVSILAACGLVLGSVAVVVPAERPPAEVAHPERSFDEALLPLPAEAHALKRARR